MTRIEEELFLEAARAADEINLKIEMTAGLPTWELMPGPKHQRILIEILNSLSRIPGHEGDRGCAKLTDVTVKFPDGSIKRPDLAIFCRQPDEDLPRVEMLPEAVVEIISPGYEAKDLQVSLPFYLAQGVKDVIVYDPATLVVIHARKDGTRRLTAPVDIDLECGCRCTIPL